MVETICGPSFSEIGESWVFLLHRQQELDAAKKGAGSRAIWVQRKQK
jgi:hypothetical protein